MKFYTLHFFHNLFMKDKPGEKKKHVAMVMMAKRILLTLSVLLILSGFAK